MRLLFLGDVVGRAGRDAVHKALPDLKRRLAPEVVVVNAENAAGGYGLSEKLAREFLELGVDCLTMGNHLWDQKDLVGAIERLPQVIRPLNYPETTPGKGAAVFAARDGRKVVVTNLLGRLFMEPVDDPFAAIDRIIKAYPLGNVAAAILVDLHAEATSEKMAMGHHLDGRVSLVVGTHTHVPTADAQILPNGTGYITDAGMCGDYDSVIGMKKEVILTRFTRKIPTEKPQPADRDASVCGVYCETDERTGLARRLVPIRIGGKLSPSLPDADVVSAPE